jgi:hypothetical protein
MINILSQLSISYIFFLGVSFVTYFLLLLSCTKGILYIFVFNVKVFKKGFLLIAIGILCLFISNLIYQFEEFVHLFHQETVTSIGWYAQTILDFNFAFLTWIGWSKILCRLKVYFGKDEI